MVRRRSRSSAENEIVSLKIKTSAEVLDFWVKIQKFSGKSETSRTSRKVQRLLRISSESFEFPADDSDFQRRAEMPPTTAGKPQKSGFSGKRLSGGRQRRKSCRASIYPAILLCAPPTKAGSRLQFSNACTAFVLQRANRSYRRIPGFPATDSAGGRWNPQSGR